MTTKPRAHETDAAQVIRCFLRLLARLAPLRRALQRN